MKDLNKPVVEKVIKQVESLYPQIKTLGPNGASRNDPLTNEMFLRNPTVKQDSIQIK